MAVGRKSFGGEIRRSEVRRCFSASREKPPFPFVVDSPITFLARQIDGDRTSARAFRAERNLLPQQFPTSSSRNETKRFRDSETTAASREIRTQTRRRCERVSTNVTSKNKRYKSHRITFLLVYAGRFCVGTSGSSSDSYVNLRATRINREIIASRVTRYGASRGECHGTCCLCGLQYSRRQIPGNARSLRHSRFLSPRALLLRSFLSHIRRKKALVVFELEWKRSMVRNSP